VGVGRRWIEGEGGRERGRKMEKDVCFNAAARDLLSSWIHHSTRRGKVSELWWMKEKKPSTTYVALPAGDLVRARRCPRPMIFFFVRCDFFLKAQFSFFLFFFLFFF
jgi:hypothetical protein